MKAPIVALLFCISFALTSSPAFLWDSISSDKVIYNAVVPSRIITNALSSLYTRNLDVVIAFFERNMSSECAIRNSAKLNAIKEEMNKYKGSYEYTYSTENAKVPDADFLFKNTADTSFVAAKQEFALNDLETKLNELSIYKNGKTELIVVALDGDKCSNLDANIELFNKAVSIITSKAASFGFFYGSQNDIVVEESSSSHKPDEPTTRRASNYRASSSHSSEKIIFTSGVLAGLIVFIVLGGMFIFGMYFLLSCQSILDDVDLSKQKVL